MSVFEIPVFAISVFEMQTKYKLAQGAAGKIETHIQTTATHDGWLKGKKVQAAEGLSLLFIWRM